MELPSPLLLRLDPNRPDPAALEQAVAVLKRGGLVVLPTETVYGLAADPRLDDARQRLYEAKGRVKDKPVAFFAADLAQIEQQGARVSERARRLARRFMPGPLTLVLPAGSGYEGFRIPDYPVALELVRRLGHVLAVTSANVSGAPPAQTAEEACRALGARVDLALDAGPSPGGVPSTVARVVDDQVEILRPGAIAEDDLMKA